MTQLGIKLINTLPLSNTGLPTDQGNKGKVQ